MQKNPDIIAAIDVGTTKVMAVVSEVAAGGNEISVIGVGSHPCKGLQKGVVVNIDTAAAAIRESISCASQQAGCQIANVFVSVGGQTTSRNSTGMVTVRGKEVEEEDVERVLETASSTPLAADQRVIHVLPQEFIVNGQDGIKNPVGMCGVRLEAKVHLITAAESNLQNLAKCVRRAGLEIEGFVLDSLAGSMAVLQNDEKELGVACIDIGGGTVHIIIYVDESVVFTATLPIGSQHITKDIAVGLNTPIGSAESLKQKYGCAVVDMVDEDEKIDIPMVGGRPEQPIPRRALCRIIQPRVEQIVDYMHRALQQSTLLPTLASGVVLVGGGSVLPGLPELAQEILEVPVRRGQPMGMGGLANMLDGPASATAAGMIRFVAERGRHIIRDAGGKGGRDKAGRGGVGRGSVWGKVGEWFKEVI